jgi:hypothetical protein
MHSTDVSILRKLWIADSDTCSTALDGAHIQYSYKHSTLVTVTVDPQIVQRNSGTPADSEEWHLPTFDPQNENKYMYKLHTVDLYFWTKEDALLFVNGVRRVLPQQQIAIQDEPIAPEAHVDDMSPVVQKLENVAITDPSYQQGRTRDSRTTTTALPGPPISATPQSQEASNFAPLAYNPAAPAAPETIQHREKTPPPEDGAANPLAAAATSDHGQAYGGPFQNPGAFSGPPQQPPPQQSYFPSIPAAPAAAPQPTTVQSPYAQHFQHSFAPPPSASTNTSSPYASVPTNPPPGPPAYTPQQQTHIPVTQYANYPGSPGMSPGMTSPSFAPPPLTHSATAPPGGFVQYNYAQNSSGLSGNRPLMNDYSIHQQLYRPTESEISSKQKPLKKGTRLESGAGALENRVTGFLKKLEKRVG